MPGDYGSLSLKFPVSDLPSNYNTSEWMADLKESIVDSLMTFNLKKSQVEIESTQVRVEYSPVTSPTPSPAQQSSKQHGLLKRSDGTLKLFVNVNILPLTAAGDDISKVKTVSP